MGDDENLEDGWKSGFEKTNSSAWSPTGGNISPSMSLVSAVIVSPLFVCACPLHRDVFRRILLAVCRCIHTAREIVGDDGSSNDIGVRVRSSSTGTSISLFLNGSSSGVRTRSTAAASDSRLVRWLDGAP